MIKANLKIAILAILAVSAIGGGVAFFAYNNKYGAPQKGSAVERIVVNLGTSESELIPKLKEQGYIKSEEAFAIVLKKKGWEGKIMPGAYNVSKSMTAWQLADVLANKSAQKWAIVPEGLRKEEVAGIVQEALGWSDAEKANFIAQSREGYLFPDTYLLDVDADGNDVILRMENRFNERTAELFELAAKENIRNDTLIVLASIIQREAAGKNDMPIIASVIWNRWLKDMPFQIDATVQYAMGMQGDWWPNIKQEDYGFDSPYNTYLHKGRPPDPICNPGVDAISAVINPPESEYLYYLHGTDGQIHPAKTYEEHLENIDEFLK